MSRRFRVRVPVSVLPLFALLGIASSAQALTLTQTIKFDEILPFGTYTDGDFLASGWNQAFPFTQASEITEIRFHFESEDEDWLDGVGPLGGEPHVEVNVLDDAAARLAIASVNLANPGITLGPAQDPLFSEVRALLLDGAITARLGGFEDHGDHSEDFTFKGNSWLTIEIDGTPSDVPPVPEPASVALLGLGLVAAGAVRYRSSRTRALATSEPTATRTK